MTTTANTSLPTPRHLGHGLTTWAMKISSHSSPILPEAIPSKFRRITRYRYNNVPMDNGGRYFYINEGGNVWSPTWKPCKTALDSYECRHGMSYTRITGSKDGIEASLLFFVPLKTWGEVQKLTLRNTSAKVRKLKLFSFAEWCLWNAATDMENFQRNFSTGEVEVDGSVIYHKTEYKERATALPTVGVPSPRTIWK